MVMNTGFTETERIIIVLAELLYCLAYTYAAWYFMKRNHRAEEIPHIIRIPTVLILFLSSVLTLRQENALLYAGCGILILFVLSSMFYFLNMSGFVEYFLFDMVVLCCNLVFKMVLDIFSFAVR